MGHPVRRELAIHLAKSTLGKGTASLALLEGELTMTASESNEICPAANFETAGPTWSERARFGELSAVISPTAQPRNNLFSHHATLAAAKFALRRYVQPPEPGVTILDYGCGTGRFIRFFGNKGYQVIGMDITPEMLEEARQFGLPAGCDTMLADGKSLSLPDASVDFIWVCGVLKYTLFPPGVPCRGGQLKTSGEPEQEFVPTYGQLAREMFRVLKPGRCVANLEMYVDMLPTPFLPEFEQTGFDTERVDVVRHWSGGIENRLQSARVPMALIPYAANLSVWFRRLRANPNRKFPGFRDYLFIWRKPATH